MKVCKNGNWPDMRRIKILYVLYENDALKKTKEKRPHDSTDFVSPGNRITIKTVTVFACIFLLIFNYDTT